jgi:hypothetical protein
MIRELGLDDMQKCIQHNPTRLAFLFGHQWLTTNPGLSVRTMTSGPNHYSLSNCNPLVLNISPLVICYSLLRKIHDFSLVKSHIFSTRAAQRLTMA